MCICLFRINTVICETNTVILRTCPEKFRTNPGKLSVSLFLEFKERKKTSPQKRTQLVKNNPYGRQRISWPMGIVGVSRTNTIWRGSVIYLKAVKLKISWEEWVYCFHFLFLAVFDFVKYVWNVQILNLDTKISGALFINVLLCNISSWNCYHKHYICDCDWLWLVLSGCDWLWLVVTGCSWSLNCECCHTGERAALTLKW